MKSILNVTLEKVNDKDSIKDLATKYNYFNEEDEKWFCEATGIILADRDYKLSVINNALEDYKDNQAIYQEDNITIGEVINSYFENEKDFILEEETLIA